MEDKIVMNWTNEEVETRYRYFKDTISGITATNKVDEFLVNKLFGVVKNGFKDINDIEVYICEHFLKTVEKSKLDRKNTFWNALSNIKYGYNPIIANSPGGKDGIYIVTEDYKPKNDMVRKLYDKYLRTDKGKMEIIKYLDIEKIVGVRIVAHGLRLLAFIDLSLEFNSSKKHKLVLVDAEINNN